VKGWSRPQDTKASDGIGGGEIREAQKACESSTLSARTMFCSGVELSSPTSMCVITFWYVMTCCNTGIHCGARRPRKSSHAHKQDIGAATRRSPKGTGLLVYFGL